MSISVSAQLTRQEKRLYVYMNIYRLAHGKGWVKLNDKLNTVAKLHLQNLKDSLPTNKKAIQHSWFADTENRWTPYVYFKLSEGQPTLNKAYEITKYDGQAAEIWAGQGDYNAIKTLGLWTRSKGHKNTIINKGCWSNTKWTGCGISIYNGQASIFLGDEK